MTYKAYTYLIELKPTNELYYGSRYSINRKNMDPDKDFWIDYFTSSEKVHERIQMYGKDAFDIKIDKVFDTAQEAIDYESDYLTEVDAKNNPLYLNGNNKGGIFPSEEHFKKISEFHKGKPKTEEHKRKISEANKGKKRPWATANLPDDTSGKNNAMYGKKHSEETIAKMSAAKKGKTPPNKGKSMSEEQKAKIRETKRLNPTIRSKESIESAAAKNRGKKRAKKLCPHCNQMIAVNVYPRYHGSNCKLNTSLGISG